MLETLDGRLALTDPSVDLCPEGVERAAEAEENGVLSLGFPTGERVEIPFVGLCVQIQREKRDVNVVI